MPRDPEGDVVPSHLALAAPPRSDLPPFMRNFPLRFGEVLEVVYPDDDRSRSGKFVEYRVMVEERWGSHAGARVYANCFLVNALAGLADREEFTLRADPKAAKEPGKGPGQGSKVVLLCINGEERSAVILGGMQDSADDSQKSSKDKKHHYFSVFNGLSYEIDDDGALTIRFNGKTKNDGTRDDSVDKNAPGAAFGLTKEGSFAASTKDSKEVFLVDHKNARIAGKADRFFFDHKNGVKIGKTTDKMMLGTTYRNAQQAMDQDLAVNFESLQGNLQAVSAALTAAGTALSGSLDAGALAAAPSITLAAQLLDLTATYMQQLGKAVAQFEGKSGQFLSQHNELD